VHLTTNTGYDAIYDPVAPWTPSADELKKLVGRYRSDEIATTYEVRLENGALVVHLDPADDFPLEPTFANAFHSGNGTLVTFTGDGFDLKSDFGMGGGTARVERLHFMKSK
jgi:hypothetical protein